MDRSSLLCWQSGLASRTGFRVSGRRLAVFRVATGRSTARARRPWAIFHIPRRITGSYIGGEFGPTSASKTLLDDVACFLYRRGSLGAADARRRLARR